MPPEIGRVVRLDPASIIDDFDVGEQDFVIGILKPAMR